MMFELSAEHLALRDKARAWAQSLESRAAEIDRTAVMPDAVRAAVGTLVSDDALGTAIAVEEIATVSAAAAALAAAAGNGARARELSGLRGAPALESSPRAQLVLAAVALGIGRAALDASLAEIKQSKATPGADTEKPHWVVADVATDLDAARLLVYKAAGTAAEADIALARLMASAASQRAVDAALRIVGVTALEPGSVLERLSRDVRAVSLVAGTEEDQRAIAADGLLPH